MKHSSFLHTFYKLCFILVITLGTSVAHAAPGVPDIISYQGRLTDDNGILLGGTGTTYYFKFSIWDSPNVGSGTRLWPTAAPNAVDLTVTDGVFDVNIGDTADGYPDSLDFDFQSNDTVYLQVEVSPTGSSYETLGPRPRITSSSTAINAKTLSGLPSSYFLDANNLSNFDSRAIAAPLTGYVSGAGVITASDTILSAIQKLNGNMGGGGAVTSVFGRTGVVTAQAGDYTTDDVTEASNLYYTQARFDTAFGLKSTSNLAEGSNLYYTDGRFDTRFATKNTDDLSEGSTNLYFTDSRFDTRLSTKSTDDLTEGANLYYTDDRARAAISSAGDPIVYDNVTGVISINQADSSTDGYLTASDWNTFNNKQDFIATGTSSDYIAGDGSIVSFPTTVSTFTNDAGYLTGNETITLSGAVTGSGTTAITTTLANGVVGIANLSATGTPSSSTYLRGDNTWATVTGGTVTSVSVSTANGFAGSVANATTTPAITITTNVTGLLKGDGTGVSAAVGGTDYENPLTFSGPLSRSVNTISITDAAADGTTKGAATFTAADFNASSGLVSIDYTNGQAASSSTKGFLTSADWTTFNNKQTALTFSTGLTNSTNTITSNLSTGVSGGQSVIGGTASGDNLTLSSTSNSTKGSILFGTSGYDEVNNRLGLGTASPSSRLHILTNSIAATQSDANGIILQNTTAATAGVPIQYSPGIRMGGSGWNTGSSISVTGDIIMDVRTTTGSANNPIWTLTRSTGGGAYSSLATIGADNVGGTGVYFTLQGTRALAVGGGITQVIAPSGTGTINFTSSTLATTWFSVTSTTAAFTPVSSTVTSGTVNSLSHRGTFAPTSGTGVWNQLSLTPTINQTGGANGITRGLYINPTITAAADWRAIEIASSSMGSGAAGPVVMIGRNSNATPGAGSINLLSNAGTNGYVWQDAAGNLRIHTAAPTNANDTAGTVVGAQTSTRETKQDIEEYTAYAEALQKIVDAPLHTFRYIKEVAGYGDDSPLAKARIGFIADEVDPAFMVGNVIDQVSMNGLLMAAIKQIDLNMQVLPVLENRSLATKIADFLRGIAETSTALVDNLKSKKVQTQELCVGDDSDQVCVTKEDLQILLQNGGVTPVTPDPSPVEGDPEQETPNDVVTETTPETTPDESSETPSEEVIEEEPVVEPETIPTEEESTSEVSEPPTTSESSSEPTPTE